MSATPWGGPAGRLLVDETGAMSDGVSTTNPDLVEERWAVFHRWGPTVSSSSAASRPPPPPTC